MFKIILVTIVGLFMVVNFTMGQNSVNFDDLLCPNHRTRCSDGQTCCSIGGGDYGCCPYANATCCRDQQSCCPSGYNCDIAAQSCQKSRSVSKSRNQYRWILLQESSPAMNETIDNTVEELVYGEKKLCPDGKQSCPESYTCCAQVSGGYGCCPLTGAICCPDGVHCCPYGSQCNTKLGSCDN